MDEHEIARRASVLPEQFTDRLSPMDTYMITSARDGGEWGEEVDNLVATLAKKRAPLTPAERDELAALLTALGHGTEQLDRLNVSG